MCEYKLQLLGDILIWEEATSSLAREEMSSIQDGLQIGSFYLLASFSQMDLGPLQAYTEASPQLVRGADTLLIFCFRALDAAIRRVNTRPTNSPNSLELNLQMFVATGMLLYLLSSRALSQEKKDEKWAEEIKYICKVHGELAQSLKNT